MALALAILLLLIAIATVTLLSAAWIPPLAASSSLAIDSDLHMNLVLLGAIFLFAQLSLGLFVWKFRERPGAPSGSSRGSIAAEVIWGAATLILFLGLGLHGRTTWAALHHQTEPTDSIDVEAT